MAGDPVVLPTTFHSFWMTFILASRRSLQRFFFLFLSLFFSPQFSLLLCVLPDVSHKLLHFHGKVRGCLLHHLPSLCSRRDLEPLGFFHRGDTLEEVSPAFMDCIYDFHGYTVLVLSAVAFEVLRTPIRDELSETHIPGVFGGRTTSSHEYIILVKLHDEGFGHMACVCSHLRHLLV